VLAIPATSAPTERLFSTAGRTITAERNRLSPDMADALIFLRGAMEVVDTLAK